MSILGILVMCGMSSCVATYPMINPEYYSEPVYSGTQNSNPIYYQGRNWTYSGVKIIGDRQCPNGLYMKDMRIIRNGLRVTVTDGTGTLIYKQYDMRVRQNVKDVFTPMSMNEVPLEVIIYINGPDKSNYVKISDGSHVDSFNLRRNW